MLIWLWLGHRDTCFPYLFSLHMTMKTTSWARQLRKLLRQETEVNTLQKSHWYDNATFIDRCSKKITLLWMLVQKRSHCSYLWKMIETVTLDELLLPKAFFFFFVSLNTATKACMTTTTPENLTFAKIQTLQMVWPNFSISKQASFQKQYINCSEALHKLHIKHKYLFYCRKNPEYYIKTIFWVNWQSL